MNYYFCVHTIGLRNLEGLGARKTKMSSRVDWFAPIIQKLSSANGLLPDFPFRKYQYLFNIAQRSKYRLYVAKAILGILFPFARHPAYGADRFIRKSNG